MKNNDKKNKVDDFIYEDKKGIEKISIQRLAEYLIEKNTFKTIYGEKSEKVYLYEDGIYMPRGKRIIKIMVEELIGSKATTYIVNEVFEKIKRKTSIDIEEFEETIEGLICLENGLYDMNNYKFMKHSPNYYFKSKLPIIYDKEKDCQNINKFFEDVLYEEDIILIQEWIGFILYNKYFEKKGVIFFGEKDTGKTITLSLISEFLGENNIISLSLQKIAYGKEFDLLYLKDKYANIFDDLGDKDINDSGGFKIATGGGSITGEYKFGDKISFKTFAKLMFACNKIPAIKDIDDDAYFGRWMPIAFDNQIKEEEQDKKLMNKLKTKDEISGLFNLAIKGFKRLRKNNKFSFNKTSGEIKQIMQRSSHPLTAFAQDCLIQDNGNRVTKDELFKAYSNWCEKENKARFTKTKLSQNLERFVPYIISSRDTQRIWLNAKLKNSEEVSTLTTLYQKI